MEERLPEIRWSCKADVVGCELMEHTLRAISDRSLRCLHVCDLYILTGSLHAGTVSDITYCLSWTKFPQVNVKLMFQLNCS